MSGVNIIGLLAETPVHAGVGQASEAIDLPVARERATSYPHVPGSGVKGAFKVWAEEQTLQEQSRYVKNMFGSEPLRKQGAAETQSPDTGDDRAGLLLFGEARLAFLPVRCTTASFKLVTCPNIINRLKRDMERSGLAGAVEPPSGLEPGHYLGGSAADAWLGLEEREFTRAGDLPDGLLALVRRLSGGIFGKNNADYRIVVLHDDDFKWFARFGLPVAMHNKLNAHKVVDRGALWAEETLPADSIMWLVLGERHVGAAASFCEKLKSAPYVQMGGNETTGQGWFKATVLEKV